MKKSAKILIASILVTSISASFAQASSTNITISDKKKEYDFEYSYPLAADKIPALKAKFNREAVAQKKELLSEVATARKENGKDYQIEFSSSTDWKTVTNIPSFLSLSGLSSTFFGGAHPNYNSSELLWDKKANKEVKLGDIFTSKEAFKKAINDKFCDRLNVERSKRRGVQVNPNSDEMYDKCVNPLDSHILLGSSSLKTFDRIGIIIDPYEAGPYAEGTYEINLKVTPEVLAVVRPQYKASFSLTK